MFSLAVTAGFWQCAALQSTETFCKRKIYFIYLPKSIQTISVSLPNIIICLRHPYLPKITFCIYFSSDVCIFLDPSLSPFIMHINNNFCVIKQKRRSFSWFFEVASVNTIPGRTFLYINDFVEFQQIVCEAAFILASHPLRRWLWKHAVCSCAVLPQRYSRASIIPNQRDCFIYFWYIILWKTIIYFAPLSRGFF